MRPAASDGATWQRGMSLVLLPALAVFAYSAANSRSFADGDTNWHVAAGRWILAHRSVPHADPFSYTATGRPWVAHEWLSEVVFSIAQAAGGWAGLLLLVAACVAVAFALIAGELQRWLGARSTVVCLVLSFFLLSPHMLARPHMLALPLLALWTTQLIEARRKERAPALWLLPLMALWANLHGSYIFGLAIAGPFALEAFLESKGRRWNVALHWGAFLVGATLMALITPNGLEGLILPFRVMQMTTLYTIGEWGNAGFKSVSALEVALMLTVFVCVYRGVRMGWIRLALILLLLHMALQHIRQEIILAVVGPLLLAEPLGRALEPRRADQTPSPVRPAWSEIVAPGFVAVALVLGIAFWRMITPQPRVDSRTVPVTALARVPPQVATRPVFNDYSFGGWLIYSGVRPFIDGRADMYGDAFYQNYMDTEMVKAPAAVDQTFRHYGVAWTILRPDSKLVAQLDKTPGWRRYYADKWAVIHIRDDVLPRDPGSESTGIGSQKQVSLFSRQ